MKSRYVLFLLLLVVVGIFLVLFLQPCSKTPPVAGIVPAAEEVSREKKMDTPSALTRPPTQKIQETTEKSDKPKAGITSPVPAKVAPRAEAIDTSEPVHLSSSDTLPDISKCVSANFPDAAKPYVQNAVVTVRLTVDRFGRVRENKPIKVDLPPDLEYEQTASMRKLFIQAGTRAFGSKKCPPHIVNGQNSGYVIEVPLQYKQ
ncbi:MAG TPA: hypothetical protein PLY93_06930 [Turneriella sp.]|nr:hypothetical protein [Turneriella sp.]